MPMTPFVERFPEQGAQETRSVIVRGMPRLPDGEYGFIELYCNEPHCDCRRVMVVVLRPETGWQRFWATINYGWESREFYQRWAQAPQGDESEWQGPLLDPLSSQSRCAPALLELFQSLLQSPEYVERLKRHYRLFRAAVEKESAGRASRPQPARAAQRRRK